MYLLLFLLARVSPKSNFEPLSTLKTYLLVNELSGQAIQSEKFPRVSRCLSNYLKRESDWIS